MIPYAHGGESASKTASQKAVKETVLGLTFRGRHRAYPLKVFASRKPINDVIGRQEIVIFHDSERDLSVAYFRMVLGEPIEFSGHVSGTVADDRTTITRWDMATGEAVGGNLFGMQLISMPVTRASWSEWFAAHPDTTVYSGSLP